MDNRYLYRAKIKYNKAYVEDAEKWVVGNLIIDKNFSGSTLYRIRPLKYAQAFAFEVNESTICQCTGRQDEWEHDIFQYDDERYEIQFCKDSLTWEAVSVFSSESLGLGEFSPSEYVRIGNSIDNPELLEVGE